MHELFPETLKARAFFAHFRHPTDEQLRQLDIYWSRTSDRGLSSLNYDRIILMKIRACEQYQNFCEHEQASTYLIFASNSSKGQILRAPLN